MTVEEAATSLRWRLSRLAWVKSVEASSYAAELPPVILVVCRSSPRDPYSDNGEWQGYRVVVRLDSD